MKPIDQTIFGFKKGNCFQACVASIFEREINDVPEFMGDGVDSFYDNLRKWEGVTGLKFINITVGDEDIDIIKNCFVIAAGPSPRDKKKNHACIYYNGKMVHDPHPDKIGIVAPEYYTIIVLQNPAIFWTNTSQKHIQKKEGE